MTVDWDHLTNEASSWPDSGEATYPIPGEGGMYCYGDSGNVIFLLAGEGSRRDTAHPEWYIKVTGSDTIVVTFTLNGSSDSGADYNTTTFKSALYAALKNIKTGDWAGMASFYYYYDRDTQFGRAGAAAMWEGSGSYEIVGGVSTFTMTYDNSTGAVQCYHHDGTTNWNCGAYSIATPNVDNSIMFGLFGKDYNGYKQSTSISNLNIYSANGTMETDLWNGALDLDFEQMEMIHPWDGLNGSTYFLTIDDGAQAYLDAWYDTSNVTVQGESSYSLRYSYAANTLFEMNFRPTLVNEWYIRAFYLLGGLITSYAARIMFTNENGEQWVIWGDYDTGRPVGTKQQIYFTEPDGTETILVSQDSTPRGIHSFSCVDNVLSYYQHDQQAFDPVETMFDDVAIWGLEIKFSWSVGPYSGNSTIYVYPHDVSCKMWPRPGEPANLILASRELMTLDIQQLVAHKYMLFFEKLINSGDAYDIETLRGAKYQDIDGFGSVMAEGSVALIIDRFHRMYLYALRVDDQIADDPPDIITMSRSIDGHYWELVDHCQKAVNQRMWSEQCLDHVTELVPGICDFTPGGDWDTYMCQLVHNGVVNPIYLRAFKVPGMARVRVEIAPDYAPYTAYNVRVNLLQVA